MVGVMKERVVEVDIVAEHGTALADAIDGALGAWVERSVAQAAVAAGFAVNEHLTASARDAGRAACTAVGPQVRELLTKDIDDQATNPLAVVRNAVRFATGVLLAAGVPAPDRDEMQARMLPDDLYDLAPATWADLGPTVADRGIAWGAAKAYEHLRRRPRPTPEPESQEPTS